jgi:hypothetical protein
MRLCFAAERSADVGRVLKLAELAANTADHPARQPVPRSVATIAT